MMRAIVLLLAMVASAEANVGRRDFPGGPAGEPAGLHAIAIEREELTFDLRPLAEGTPVRVTARYHLVNSGEAVTAPLVFVTGVSDFDNVRVTLDGNAVSSNPERLSDWLPASWAAPRTTPALDGGEALSYATEKTSSVSFALTIPAGRHELVVTYAARPQMTRSRAGGTLLWQLGYVLAPARDWGSFGALDVSVQVPSGWRAAVSPPLARGGDTLRAHFTALPADTLGISLQAPTGALHDVLQIALPLLLAIVVLGGIFAMYLIGRASRTRLVAFAAAFAWAIAIAVAGGMTAMRASFALPPHQAAIYGYGPGLGVVGAILGAIVAIPIGYVLARRSPSSI